MAEGRPYFSAFPAQEEARRAIVRLSLNAMNAYMRQGVYTTMNAVLKRVQDHTLRSVVNGKAVQTSFAAGFGMQDMASIVTSDSVSASFPQVAQMGTLFAQGLQYRMNRKVGLLEVHKEAAERAQQVTVDAYMRNVESVKKVESYREGQDRLPHKMLEALRRPDFVQATVDGVLFANTGMLDAVAAHWYRLNFGAGSVGANRFLGAEASFTVKFFGQSVGTMRLRGEPSDPFTIPKGVFINGSTGYSFSSDRRGLDKFYPLYILSGSTPQVAGGPATTRGIVGRHFLDAGIGSLANFLPRQYEGLVTQWLNEASKDAGRRGPLGNSIESSEAIARRASIVAGEKVNQRARLA